MTARYQIVRTNAGHHQRLIGGNGEPVSTTEVHPDSRDALSSIAVAAEAFGITMRRPPEEHDGHVWGYDVRGHLVGARVEYVDERDTEPEHEPGSLAYAQQQAECGPMCELDHETEEETR